MLVLVATTETQGRERGDYCHTVEGELVTPLVVECCTPDSCGCGRGFPGLASNGATTTALVVERSGVTLELLRQSVADSLTRSGWRDPHHPDEFDELVDAHVDAIGRLARAFGEGTVVRRDGARCWGDRRRDVA